MSVFSSQTITLTYGYWVTSRNFNIQMAEDDSFVIECLKKQKLYLLTDMEKFIGWKRKITIRFQPLSSTDLAYLTAFCMDADNFMTLTMNSVTYNVQLANKGLSLSLILNYIGAQKISWTFTEASLTRTLSRTYALGSSNSGSYGGSLSSDYGTAVELSYNYGDGDVLRMFRVHLINSLDADIQRKNFKYIDYDSNVVNLGIKVLTNIHFMEGGASTPAQQQDDRNWLREFVLAPTKYIAPVGQYESQVCNNFTEVNYTLTNGLIYGKTTSLSFRQIATTTSVPAIEYFTLNQDNLNEGVLK